MNEPSHRLNLQGKVEEQSGLIQSAKSETTGLEFARAEDMLRHDAASIELPTRIAEQLAQSAAAEPPVPWWKRLIGG